MAAVAVARGGGIITALGGTPRFHKSALIPQTSEMLAAEEHERGRTLGVLIRAGELQLRIPEDVSITGFDDIPVSGIVGPGLTTASVSKTNLGRLAHELLSVEDVDRRVIVRPSLIVQGSTGPPVIPHRITVGKPAPG